jgi:5-methyltetrahydrofolate--homocysteine methyltransferase
MLSDLGCRTSLGVSNVSFGLPAREIINSNFFTLAMGHGLSFAIMNPYSEEMMKAYRSYLALAGLDDNCQGYVSYAAALPSMGAVPEKAVVSNAPSSKKEEEKEKSLSRAIEKGLKEEAARLTADLLTKKAPLDVVNGEIIPALDRVGVDFEEKRVYLPGLLMSAEAAKASFEKIKEQKNGSAKDKCAVVLATVKGDIHDIGKNIVKLLLENYSFDVLDLGKDVSPEEVLAAVVEKKAPLAGLSALMTTTVPAMEETIALLRKSGARAKVVVGGAVLTQEYADMIHADHYAKDAMETVRYAEELFAE